ncbi:hypothetical protein COU75_04660 [Candidatus Peregrinibacteria bacterium CG10_big_fil_rev_8_21_14_0_10_42_8]|nr:MAG: hypothetical protein COU75_04660 [Candidatus Peregrinibacteria bacterium CG10_big_fil_rev_8_21_14_0_10_42_8]
MTKKPNEKDKLDTIVWHLERMDKRDKLRTWGSFFKGLMSIIPVIAFIWGAWYFSQHGDEIMAKIAKQAAEQAAEVTKQGTNSILDRMKNLGQ